MTTGRCPRRACCRERRLLARVGLLHRLCGAGKVTIVSGTTTPVELVKGIVLNRVGFRPTRVSPRD
eukprot:scaffold14091_cov52-Phaeocystis_antarctica.AAC.2